MDLFLLGCVGGVLAYIVTLALPMFRKMYEAGTFDPTFVGVIGALGILVALVALGGVSALLFGGDATATKDAILYGVAGESLVTGALRTAGER